MSFEWRLIDDNQNRLLETIKAKAVIFLKLQKIFFLETLVKNEAVVEKY